MKLNLQFFGEEALADDSVGVEASDVTAEQTETVGEVEVTNESDATETETEVVEKAQDTETESKRDYNKDSIYADARRKYEAEAKEQQAKRDAEFVRRFGSYKNPLTGEPIRSEADYFAALDAQEQMRVENELKDKGIDMSLVQKLIDNTPVVKQAREYMERAEREEVMRKIDADFNELIKLDDSIKQFDDIPKDVVELSQNSHISLTNAYKILNFGKISEKNMEAARQSAVNQVKGKQHLAPMNGVATNNAEVEIPADELNSWRAVFPGKTDAQLRTIYNKNLK